MKDKVIGREEAEKLKNEATGRIDPGECEKYEKDGVHHWAQVWNIHGVLTSSWPLGFAP